MLLVGLGGGGLAQFLRNFVPNVTVEAVELDPVVLEVATEWFGFRPDDRLTVTIGDGLERIGALEREGEEKLTCINMKLQQWRYSQVLLFLLLQADIRLT